MILDTTTKIVRAFLGGAVATNQPEWNTSWADHRQTAKQFKPGHNSGALNGVTSVTLVAAPPATEQRHVKGIWIFNADTANVTVTVEVFDGTSARRWIRALLETLWTLAWEPGGTWHVYDENGIIQTSLATAPAGITVEEVDGVPYLAGTTTLRFDQADGFVLTQPGANIARVDFTGGAASTAYRRWAYMFR